MRFIEFAETGNADVDVFEGKVAWIGKAKLDFLATKRETGNITDPRNCKGMGQVKDRDGEYPPPREMRPGVER